MSGWGGAILGGGIYVGVKCCVTYVLATQCTNMQQLPVGCIHGGLACNLILLGVLRKIEKLCRAAHLR